MLISKVNKFKRNASLPLAAMFTPFLIGWYHKHRAPSIWLTCYCLCSDWLPAATKYPCVSLADEFKLLFWLADTTNTVLLRFGGLVQTSSQIGCFKKVMNLATGFLLAEVVKLLLWLAAFKICESIQLTRLSIGWRQDTSFLIGSFQNLCK